MVKVEIAGITATINDYEWTSDNKHLEALLNAMLDPYGPSGADPYPDLTAATEATKTLGGKVIEHDEPKSEAGTIE